MFEVQQSEFHPTHHIGELSESFDEGQLQLGSLIFSVIMASDLDIETLTAQEHSHLQLLTPFYWSQRRSIFQSLIWGRMGWEWLGATVPLTEG